MKNLFDVWDEQAATVAIEEIKKQTINLRPYQVEAVAATYSEWEKVQSTLINMATGLGKSVCFAEVMRRWDVNTRGRILLIAHRTELIYQAVGHAKRAGLTSGVEMASQRVLGTEDVIIASVQTLNASSKCPACHGEGCDECHDGKVKRFTRFNPRDFGLVTIDEAHHACFVAGTKIDGVSIEDIKVGMRVKSYNHEANAIEYKNVLEVSCVPTEKVALAKFSNGKTIVCTPDHRFFDGEKYVEIKDIPIGGLLYCITAKHKPTRPYGISHAEDIKKDLRNLQHSVRAKKLELKNDSVLLSQMRIGRNQAKEKSGSHVLRNVRQRCRVLWKNWIELARQCQKGPRLLLCGMQGQDRFSYRINDDVLHESHLRFRSDEEKQPYAERGSQAKDGEFIERKNFPWAWWKWKADKAAGSDVARNGIANGSGRKNDGGCESICVSPILLQGGFGLRGSEARSGDRREVASSKEMDVFGQEKNANIECVRLESLEILERGCGQRFAELCIGGAVYNLTVEGNHNYFANGILVHNCAKSYRNVLTWFNQNTNQKTLLVTATPKRSDKVGLHNVCDSVSYEKDLRNGIEDGWLVPIRQKFVTVEGLDISRVNTTKGDLAQGELQDAFLGTDEAEERMLHAIVKPTLMEAAGRKTLVFASGQEHANKLAACFNANGVEAGVVIDSTDPIDRTKVVKRFRDGELQVLVNCLCLCEGFDAPETAVIANCRPTKSESLYLQIIGRGTRPLAGIVDGPPTADERKAAIAVSDKGFTTVLDFVGNSGEHKLISVLDVLAGTKLDPIDLEEAIAVAKESGEAVDMESLAEKIKQARIEGKKREEEDRRRRLMTNTKADRADYTAVDVDLFGGKEFKADRDVKMITSNQQKWLRHRGVSFKESKHLTFRQARKAIQKYYDNVVMDWKTLMQNSATCSELRQVGFAIQDRKETDWMLKNLDVIKSLKEAYSERFEIMKAEYEVSKRGEVKR